MTTDKKITIPDELHAALTFDANAQGVSFSHLVSERLRGVKTRPEKRPLALNPGKLTPAEKLLASFSKGDGPPVGAGLTGDFSVPIPVIFSEEMLKNYRAMAAIQEMSFHNFIEEALRLGVKAQEARQKGNRVVISDPAVTGVIPKEGILEMGPYAPAAFDGIANNANRKYDKPVATILFAPAFIDGLKRDAKNINFEVSSRVPPQRVENMATWALVFHSLVVGSFLIQKLNEGCGLTIRTPSGAEIDKLILRKKDTETPVDALLDNIRFKGPDSGQSRG